MPITKFQSDVLRLLAAQRSPDSYIAGGVAINREGPRISADIAIFPDLPRGWTARSRPTKPRSLAAATRSPGRSAPASMLLRSKNKASVCSSNGWRNSAFRFFPTQPDELFGYVLHPVDLATNKASAAADLRVPRDVVDPVTIHEDILPLGAVAAAAVGKFPGTTPEEMLAEITRHSRFTAEEFNVLATEQPIDVPGLHRRIRRMIEDAESFIAKLPSDAVGVVFMDGEKPVQPDVTALGKYQQNPGAPRGFWPSSPEISRAMLERYGKPKP